MISSLPGIIAAELAAHPVAIRTAMPIACRNPDRNIARRIKLMSCSRKAPVPQARPCQNNASQPSSKLPCRHTIATIPIVPKQPRLRSIRLL
jgi:hypothetical protein